MDRPPILLQYPTRSAASTAVGCMLWAEPRGQPEVGRMTYWEFKGRELVNCTCEYGCNCQFNALPDKGHCHAVAGIQIDQGHHGDTRLDGLKIAAIFKWPGPIHEL